MDPTLSTNLQSQLVSHATVVQTECEANIQTTDEITGLKTKKNLKLQVYFKIIAYKSKTKSISKG